MFVSNGEGRVKIFRVQPNGDAVTLFLFGPGDVKLAVGDRVEVRGSRAGEPKGRRDR